MELVYFDITFINKEYVIPKKFRDFILTNDYYDFEKYFNSNTKKYTDEELKRKNCKKFAITFKESKFYQWLIHVEAEEVSKENVVIFPIFMLTANKLMSNKYKINKIMTTLGSRYEYAKFKDLIGDKGILYIDTIKFSYSDINYYLKINLNGKDFDLSNTSTYDQEKYDQVKKAISETNNKYKNFKIDEILKEVEKEYNNTVISEEIIY